MVASVWSSVIGRSESPPGDFTLACKVTMARGCRRMDVSIRQPSGTRHLKRKSIVKFTSHIAEETSTPQDRRQRLSRQSCLARVLCPIWTCLCEIGRNTYFESFKWWKASPSSVETQLGMICWRSFPGTTYECFWSPVGAGHGASRPVFDSTSTRSAWEPLRTFP